MKLFAREWGEWQTDDEYQKAWAHGVLDLWMAGEHYEMTTINHALRITGDLVGLDCNATMRGHVPMKEAA